jgi:adenylate cyclase
MLDPTTSVGAQGSNRAFRRPSLRQIRLATSLVLFAYVTHHFIDHALGNISVTAMERGLFFQKLVWQSLPGAVLLYASLLTHAGLGFWALYERRHFRWTRLEATQLVFGLCIPFLLADHLVGTRVALSLFALQKGYAEELLKFWVNAPVFGVLQTISLLVVWVHGCLGLHFWLRLKPFYVRGQLLLFALAVLLPALALLGYYQGGQAVIALVREPDWRAAHLTPEHTGGAEQNALLATYRNWLLIVLVATVVATFVARLVRRWLEGRRGLVTLLYPERLIRVPRGLSVLEASLRHNIPHAHVCGGRGRCSTCRIRLIAGYEQMPPASDAEQAVLDRLRGGTSVRLACQLRPQADVSFVPLLPPQATVANAYRRNQPHHGDELYLVPMFVDMRGSTKLAEERLPFDTVFLINCFLQVVSAAVIEAGGTPNQILGDGLLALFGLQTTQSTACRQAIDSCWRIAANVGKLNILLRHELPDPIGFGIGIHTGPAIVGDIGYEKHAAFTVIGDTVNVAARLQDLTKSFGSEVLMSEEVFTLAGLTADALPQHEVTMRGRAATLRARGAVSAADLEGLLRHQTGAPIRAS